ncbi:unnamed protein product, partial [Darwinula stevensoni]
MEELVASHVFTAEKSVRDRMAKVLTLFSEELELINFDKVLLDLRGNEIVTHREYLAVAKTNDSKEKVLFLLECLPRSGDGAFPAFVEALQKWDHVDLAEKLKDGKSSFVDALFNYVVGVTFDDDFRFTITSPNETNQEESLTKTVTAYSLGMQDIKGSRFRWPLTIVDTPGFGDIEGIEEDRKRGMEDEKHGIIFRLHDAFKGHKRTAIKPYMPYIREFFVIMSEDSEVK